MLPKEQLRDVMTLRHAFVDHFATQARRQAGLQKFYQATQLPSKSANQYYGRIKALARAAFHEKGAKARALARNSTNEAGHSSRDLTYFNRKRFCNN